MWCDWVVRYSDLGDHEKVTVVRVRTWGGWGWTFLYIYLLNKVRLLECSAQTNRNTQVSRKKGNKACADTQNDILNCFNQVEIIVSYWFPSCTLYISQIIRRRKRSGIIKWVFKKIESTKGVYFVHYSTHCHHFDMSILMCQSCRKSQELHKFSSAVE